MCEGGMTLITREEAMMLVTKSVSNKNLIGHMLATEAVMIGLAEHFHEDPEIWGMAGLLHDLDYDDTKDKPEMHGIRSVELLQSIDVPQEVLHAILAHCDKKPAESLMEKAIYCADPVTGLIVAGALIRKERKLSFVDVPFLMNRFKEKSFARGADRDQIMQCEKIGLDLETFLGIALSKMQAISDQLGL